MYTRTSAVLVRNWQMQLHFKSPVRPVSVKAFAAEPHTVIWMLPLTVHEILCNIE